MNELPTLEHAVYGARGDRGYRFLARSPGFLDEWLPEAERLCTGFGERPAGVACPRAVFAQPFGKGRVAVVQVADQGQDDQGRPGALAFYLVVVPAGLYEHLGGDPFVLADRMPPPWSAQDTLAPLACPAPAPARRTVEEVCELLKAPNSATLFGGTQALLDGARLAFERPAPDDAILRNLWKLLPAATRKDLWPASFAFGNALGFHALVVPRLEPAMFSTYLLEDKAGDYPDGQYEMALQTAAEAGDQAELDALFARRSYKDTRKLALVLLGVVLMLPLLFSLMSRREDPPPERGEKGRPADEVTPANPDRFEMPSAASFPPLSEEETAVLTARLHGLAGRVGARAETTVPTAVLAFGGTVPSFGAAPLGAAAALAVERDALAGELLHGLNRRLGTPNKNREGRDLYRLGPVERQLRGLLYKHNVERYNDRRLSPTELVDRLEEKVTKDRERSP